MSNGDILSRDDRIREAQRTLEELGVPRGDSFDIGSEVTRYEGQQDAISQYLSNPKQLSQLFNLTESQAANIRSLIVGGGTGTVHKILNQHFGDEISGVIGGLVSGYLAKRIIGR